MNDLLLPFRSCFSRHATFEWFVVIVVGFMLRSDHLGVTSVIRDLSLNGRCYGTLLHFFRSSVLPPGRWTLCDGLGFRWFVVPLHFCTFKVAWS
ncbi:hypothetical protein [Paenibacillus maysiensis]|uniref:hypothetical protein n=1 Tax=Paenibacillus maysiensis TaxID=1155954 RepID=UPI001ADFAA1A|nr:hypothetical protein [Paenibacillus maysiensis]